MLTNYSAQLFGVFHQGTHIFNNVYVCTLFTVLIIQTMAKTSFFCSCREYSEMRCCKNLQMDGWSITNYLCIYFLYNRLHAFCIATWFGSFKAGREWYISLSALKNQNYIISLKLFSQQNVISYTLKKTTWAPLWEVFNLKLGLGRSYVLITKLSLDKS